MKPASTGWATGPAAKACWAVPALVVAALLCLKSFRVPGPDPALVECASQLADVRKDRADLKKRQEDGSLLVGLTAASFLVTVASGNEDILKMSPRAMAKQIEQLREIVNRYNVENKRLAADKRQLAEEKEQAVDKLARHAVLSSADVTDGHVACDSKVRSLERKLAALKDDVESRKTEQMTTKARLDEIKDQAKQAEAAMEAATQDLVAVKSKLEQARVKLSKCGEGLLQAALSKGADRSFLGYKCEASEADMRQYFNFTPGKACPNDWFFVQSLIFRKNCFALPRRRCRVLTPSSPVEPLPLPQSLFDQAALNDNNVRWDLHHCTSFECLNARTQGECWQCFNLTLEETRWKDPFRGTIPMKDVVEMKKGSLRLGLDVGGGTGSFAAHMARFGVTVMTTAFNAEIIPGQKSGLPYMETIAARGLIPLHVPHASRLPLFDGVLDVVHAANSLKYISPAEFEETMYEWDRILRVGGILWFEMFSAPVSEMPKYVAVIHALSYKELYWNFTPRPGNGVATAEQVYLNCILEKQPHASDRALKGTPAGGASAV